MNTADNVVDGTPCSYDDASNMCVQGECVKVGCDKILGSPLSEDQCGICAGDGTKCSTVSRTIKKKLGRELTKFMVIPKGVRNIEIEEVLVQNTSLLLMRERRSGVDFFDSSSFKGLHWTTIAEGAKFQFHKTKQRMIVTARGPTLAPIIVGLKSPERVEREIKLKYITESLEQTHSSRHRLIQLKQQQPILKNILRFEWQIKGWSKCSKECGGGKQKLVIRCFDSKTGKRIRRKLCGPKRSRPRVEKRSCNNFGCETHWVAADWEQCTATCGKHGTKHR